jgi:hypothetical protein
MLLKVLCIDKCNEFWNCGIYMQLKKRGSPQKTKLNYIFVKSLLGF